MATVAQTAVALSTRIFALLVALAVDAAPTLSAQQPRDSLVTLKNDSVAVRLVEADVRAAIQALAPYLDRPVIFGNTVPGARITLETPRPVPRTEVVGLLKGLLASQSLELVSDSGFYRVQPKMPAPPPSIAPLSGGGARATGPVQLFVLHLHHARAADVAATVNALYGRASALGELGAGRPPTLDQQLQANQVPPVGMAASEAVPSVAGRGATLTGEVTIVPDPRSNSLLIRASESDFALIEAAVKELDTRPLQVLIEVVIAELRRDRQFAFGVGAELGPTRIRGSQTTVSGTQQGLGVADLVLQAMHIGNLDLDATLGAAEARGDVRILSRPVVIAANNELATINVGSQRPFIQVSRALPTDNAARDQVVQYKDVGTRLLVVPTISPDGYVGLSVTQEVNSATSEVAFDAPVISTRSVQTRLLIKDGQTVALGGLTDKQKDASQGGVPLLSSIPLLGGLFGHASRRTTETELFLFLTPHVIRTDADATSLSEPLLKRAEKAKP